MRVVRRPQASAAPRPLEAPSASGDVGLPDSEGGPTAQAPSPADGIAADSGGQALPPPAAPAVPDPDTERQSSPTGSGADGGRHEGWMALDQATPKRTRASMAWVAVVACFVVLALIIVFVLQNLARVDVHFLFLHFRLPLGVALLIGILVGGAVVLGAGLARIRELRKHLRRP